MCGRYISSDPVDVLARFLRTGEIRAERLEPSWNVAPTDEVYAAAEHGGVRALGTFRWGLVPPWAADPSIASRLINARAETLAGKPAFKEAFARRRCLVPAGGFYEWVTVDGRRQPYLIHRRDGNPLAFAGLWSVWRDRRHPDRPPLRTCTIVTTTPNSVVAPLHDRMPVALPASGWDDWLDPGNADTGYLMSLLVPAPAEEFEAYPVGPHVNSVRNNGPHLVAPV